MIDLKEFFKKDLFATNAGMAVTEIGDDYAIAEMDVKKEHLNAGGSCQGGAIFTLADLAMAAVANSHGKLTVTVNSNIAFLAPAFDSDHLIAKAIEVNNHKRLPFIEVKVTNSKNKLIATVSGSCYRKDVDI